MKTPYALLALLVASACSAKADRTPEAPLDDAAPAAASVSDLAGTYALTSQNFTATPQGCRGSDSHHEDWSLAMDAPQEGPWDATESYGEHSSKYTCEGSSKSFACESVAGHDYTTHGVDADVKLDVQYDGVLNGAGQLEGTFELAFTCEGTACAEVASQWGVTGFPCENAGTFTGDRGAA